MKSFKIQGKTHIEQHTVRKWLQNQDSYSLQKPIRRSFKRARVIVSGINDQVDADLADVSNISKENDGVKYNLFVIDIFSRYLWIEPLQNKTGKEVVNGLKTIFSKGRTCRTIQVDRGKKFSNSHVMNYLKDESIYFCSTQNWDTKANYTERVIQTIKNMMFCFFTKEIIVI